MRTIKEVVDHESEDIISADVFFAEDEDVIFKQRYELERAIQSDKKIWVCPFCRRPIKIRGKKEGDISLHFSHVPDGLDCPYKTWKNYTKDQILRMKYNGQKESPKHYYLKNVIAEKLSRDPNFSDIKVDERFEGICKNWRKPDVSALYKGKRVVFELQLTTTFLSVIAERNTFYETNETYILWLFDNKRKNVQNMRFMEKDIFYPNHHNAFFIDQNSSDANFDLICGYEKPILNNGNVESKWQIHNVDFSDLTFGDNFRLYWFDYEKELASIREELRVLKLNSFEKLWQCEKNENERMKAFNNLKRMFDSQPEDIKDYELIGLIDCLYSIKFKKVIGYKYARLIQLLHQFFQKDMGGNSHFGEYVLKAIGIYGSKYQILKEDKTGKFVDKARLYVKHKFELSHKYDRILEALFPELFQ